MIHRLIGAMVRGLTRNAAFTSRGSPDPRLRGRTYAIAFDDVWRASVALVGGGLNRWELLETDDEEGTIRGIARSRIDRLTSAITVRITLDLDGQTRVDALASSAAARADLGVNARRLHHFFTSLDRRLEERRDAGISALRLDVPVHADGA